MSATWSEAKAKVSHRLAMYLRVDSFRLLNKTPMVSFTFDDIPKSAATTGARLLDEHGA
jgi:peptidoglycan/xylan/chitin deacetylase (PgdA/CDA1 family)